MKMSSSALETRIILNIEATKEEEVLIKFEGTPSEHARDSNSTFILGGGATMKRRPKKKRVKLRPEGASTLGVTFSDLVEAHIKRRQREKQAAATIQ